MPDDDVPPRNAMDALRNEIEALERRLRIMRNDVERSEELPASINVVPCVTGETQIAVPLSNIEHVVGIARLSPTRDAPPWIRGLLDLRSVMIPVVDVGVRFGHAPRPFELGDLIIICNSHRGRVGLWVEAVHGVVTIRTATLDRNMPEVIGAPHLLGVTVFEGKPTYLLHLDAMLGSFVLAGKDA